MIVCVDDSFWTSRRAFWPLTRSHGNQIIRISPTVCRKDVINRACFERPRNSAQTKCDFRGLVTYPRSFVSQRIFAKSQVSESQSQTNNHNWNNNNHWSVVRRNLLLVYTRNVKSSVPFFSTILHRFSWIMNHVTANAAENLVVTKPEIKRLIYNSKYEWSELIRDAIAISHPWFTQPSMNISPFTHTSRR